MRGMQRVVGDEMEDVARDGDTALLFVQSRALPRLRVELRQKLDVSRSQSHETVELFAQIGACVALSRAQCSWS